MTTPNLRESAKRLRVCTVHRAWECHCGNGCLVTTDSFDSSNTLCDHTDKLNPPSDCKIQTWVPLSAYDAQAAKIEELESELTLLRAKNWIEKDDFIKSFQAKIKKTKEVLNRLKTIPCDHKYSPDCNGCMAHDFAVEALQVLNK